MRIFLPLILFLILLSGCTSAPVIEGAGEVHHLTINRVIYRDLTQPISLHNPQTAKRVIKDAQYIDAVDAKANAKPTVQE